MAILGPSQGPTVLKLNTNSIKAEVLSHFGHPVTRVELDETHFEMLLRTAGDFIAGYFPFEERYAVFYTKPLVSEYPLPADAYWIKALFWDPAFTRMGDIFGAESFLFNIGNITGVQNLLLDYHMLQAYRKFSSRILGTEGRWEVKGDNQIRLSPVPRGSFPVFVEYFPSIQGFRTPMARDILRRYIIAEASMILGNIRGKRAIITPDGGSTTMNGEALYAAGKEDRDECLKLALSLGEPPGIYPL